jgi:hypothetical protein
MEPPYSIIRLRALILAEFGIDTKHMKLKHMIQLVREMLEGESMDLKRYQFANFGGWPVLATKQACELYELHVALARHFSICGYCNGKNVDESLTNGADYDMRVSSLCDSCATKA